ncbi:hypothetical protein [Polyangium fumosum]|uniref:hypothetical protein n=1 Tax=Polyangium fumosum TaxID=889272 RepID=UPI0014782B00|nr:hypothetical protein [Polyangium fumosum]
MNDIVAKIPPLLRNCHRDIPHAHVRNRLADLDVFTLARAVTLGKLVVPCGSISIHP